MRSGKIKVLIVDDSSLVRQSLARVLATDRQIEVAGTASDPYAAARKLKEIVPDVITLDVEMPRMDGLTFLRKIMAQHPVPVVIISSLGARNSETAIKALEYGAVDIIHKPQLGVRDFIEDSRVQLCETVKGAAMARVKRKAATPATFKVTPKLSADSVLGKPVGKSMIRTTEKIVAIGASTGGTEAIRHILESLPGDSPGIVIVQHMPEVFTRSFANRLNNICQITVKEAQNGDSVIRGRALIAPGNQHMLLKRSGARYYVEVADGPLVNRHRPAVDVLFRSAARYAGKNSIGILLTGMGADGASGLLEMRSEGSHTIAQDEESCIVFGMPKEAIKLNAAEKVLPLSRIAEQIACY